MKFILFNMVLIPDDTKRTSNWKMNFNFRYN